MTAEHSAFARRLQQLQATGAPTAFEAFRGIDDDLWFWIQTERYHASPWLKAMLPRLADDDTQRRFTGRTGYANLEQAFHAYVRFRQAAQEVVGNLADAHVLDFGCGWGRILRFWLKDLPTDQLWGVDAQKEAIDLCADLGLHANLFHTPTHPPAEELRTDGFSVIYAYSVFSHLSEELSIAWVREFHRILRPGGVAILTIRPRDFIEMPERARRMTPRPPWASQGLLNSFLDSDAWMAKYDAGEFCFEPTGGGGVLKPAIFGQAVIPLDYVRRHWAGDDYEFIEHQDPLPGVIEQTTIVLKKR